ncbi:MAG: XisI protein [Scytonematopsis contorta HA4267-MV1]|nr:XisI protein [Scytonematopsis contorta HA4267-MV1]
MVQLLKVQYNGTEIGFADELVKLGIAKEDIALART